MITIIKENITNPENSNVADIIVRREDLSVIDAIEILEKVLVGILERV